MLEISYSVLLNVSRDCNGFKRTNNYIHIFFKIIPKLFSIINSCNHNYRLLSYPPPNQLTAGLLQYPLSAYNLVWPESLNFGGWVLRVVVILWFREN